MNILYLALTVIVLISGCSTRGTLTDEIAEERREIARLESELATASTALPNDRNLYVALKYRRLAEWLREVTTPSYAIHGVGFQRDGDLVYVGGVGKAWIEPEDETWFDLRIRQLQLSGTSAGVDVTGNIYGNMEMRIRTYIFNIGSNVLCEGRLDSTRINANLALSSVASNTVPFTLSLVSPSSVPIQVECRLGQLGSYHKTFQVKDLAKTLSNGNIELGWATRGTLIVPSGIGGITYTYSLMANSPRLTTRGDRLEYATNVDVSVTNTSGIKSK